MVDRPHSPSPNETPPEGWHAALLSELSEIRFSNVDKKSEWGESPVRLCNYTDVYFNDYVTADMKFMRATATRSEIARFALSEGDVVITKDSETPDDIGVPALIDSSAEDLLCGYHLAIIKPRSSMDPTFLAKQLSQPRIRRYFGQQANGTTRYGLSAAAIEHTTLWLAPIDQQRQIGQIARLIDAAIEKTAAVIAKLKLVRAGLRQTLLVCGLDDSGRLRSPSANESQFQDSVLGPIPNEWEVRRLDQLVEVLDHLRVPVNSDERHKRSGNVPYYGANGQQGWIDVPLFNEPLVLLAEDGGNFDDFDSRPIAYRIAGPSWVNNHAHVLRAANGNDLGYVYFALEHRDIRRYIAGSTRSKLTQRELRSIEIACPRDPQEQRAISARLEAADGCIRAWELECNKLRSIKLGLMDDLLSGRVSVSIPEEAEVGV